MADQVSKIDAILIANSDQVHDIVAQLKWMHVTKELAKGPGGSFDHVMFRNAVNRFLGGFQLPVPGYLISLVSSMGRAERKWGDPIVIVILANGIYEKEWRLPELVSKHILWRRLAFTGEGYRCLCVLIGDVSEEQERVRLLDSGVDLIWSSQLESVAELEKQLRDRYKLVSRLNDWHQRSLYRDALVAAFAFFVFGVYQQLGSKTVERAFALFQAMPYVMSGDYAFLVFLCCALVAYYALLRWARASYS